MPYSRKKATEYYRKWRKKNRGSTRHSQRGFYQRRRAQLNQLKSKPCMDCRRRYPPECMQFDHVRGKKLFSIGINMYRQWEVLEKEIAKCDIVCANCHAIRTQRRRKKK